MASGKSTVAQLTPRIGMWLDSTNLTPDETVSEILARLEDEGHYEN